jgi:hypothetical protein
MLKLVYKEEKSVKHIADIVGEWGQWQKHLLWYCFLLSAVSALENMGYTFHTYSIDFWCSDVPIDYPVFAILVQILAKNFIFQMFSLIMFFFSINLKFSKFIPEIGVKFFEKSHLEKKIFLALI